MTEYELDLYKKCMRKVPKRKKLIKSDYEVDHEYDNETNEVEHEKMQDACEYDLRNTYFVK